MLGCHLRILPNRTHCGASPDADIASNLRRLIPSNLATSFASSSFSGTLTFLAVKNSCTHFQTSVIIVQIFLKHQMSNNKTNFLEIGWCTLHDAALKFGAEWDYYPPHYPKLGGKSYIVSELYASLTKPVLNYCRIELDEALYGSEYIRNKVWATLKEDKCQNAEAIWKKLFTKQSIRSLLKDVISERWFNDYRREAPTLSIIQPHTIANYAMWLIDYEEPDQVKRFSNLLWSVGLIGLLQVIFSGVGKCHFCYRNAWLGGVFCEQHSQREADETSRSEKYMRYRIGRKAHALAREKGLLEKIHGNSMFASVNNALIMSDMLFKRRYDSENQKHDVDLILHAINSSPRVSNMLDINSINHQDYEVILIKLRGLLDPYEWDSAMWPWKIIAAEQWFELEAEVAKDVRGDSKKTTRRIELAKQMFADGLKKSEVANKLGVSPSAISKWLKRKSELVMNSLQ